MKCILICVLLFVNISIVYNSEQVSEPTNKPGISNEKWYSTEEEVEEDDGLMNPIFQIDKEIKQEINNPTAPEVSFEIQLKILKNLVQYYNRLKDIYEGIQKNIYKKLNLGRELVKQDGPIFIKEEVDEEKLTKVYNWDEESLEFFRDYVNDIKELWLNTTIALKEKPSPIDIYLDKNVGL